MGEYDGKVWVLTRSAGPTFPLTTSTPNAVLLPTLMPMCAKAFATTLT